VANLTREALRFLTVNCHALVKNLRPRWSSKARCGPARRSAPTGEGLLRVDEAKSAAGRRTIPLPRFAVEMLQKRRHLPYLGEQTVIFPSTAGTLRDPTIS
jgi:hypothetical protein